MNADKKLDICEQLKGHSLSLLNRKVPEGDIEAEDVKGPKCLGAKPRAKEILRISIPDYIWRVLQKQANETSGYSNFMENKWAF